MIQNISIFLVLLIAFAAAQWDTPDLEDSGFSWENAGNNLNQNNRQTGNNQGSLSWGSEEDSQFNRPGFNQNRPGFNQNRPGFNQNRPGNNQNRPGNNQNRPGNNQNRPGNNQNGAWNRPTSSTTSRSTTTRRQQSTTTTSTTGSDFSTTASPAFTSCMTLCRTTPEYNPVCGSDSRTYSNEQRLNCAINCGLNINLAFRGACQPA
ncbi:insoluble matrix shell protein 4-like [Harmonia axyridis]|uniref:insoluble matrix shell protein 4-like n=1 Tax=Harmonia axyridis TaxID=115357 RepID=UPI001E278B14|nr:insoluble matrix shell protein 4-like [Harmonia axyridis]